MEAKKLKGGKKINHFTTCLINLTLDKVKRSLKHSWFNNNRLVWSTSFSKTATNIVQFVSSVPPQCRCYTPYFFFRAWTESSSSPACEMHWNSSCNTGGEIRGKNKINFLHSLGHKCIKISQMRWSLLLRKDVYTPLVYVLWLCTGVRDNAIYNQNT